MHRFIATSLAVVTAFTTINYNISSTAWNSINNYSNVIDVKDYEFETVKEATKKITGTASRDDSLDNVPIKNTIDLGRELSYLIDEDLLNRQFDFKFNGDSTQKQYVYNRPFNKSDLYMTLHRITYGNKESRYLRFNKESVRGGQVLTGIVPEYYGVSVNEKEETRTSYDGDFTKGDYWLYKTNDVYELYFYDMLSKGLLLTEDLDGPYGKSFLRDVENINAGKLPLWWPDSGQYNVKSSSKVLGYSYTVSLDGIKKNPGNYFDSETMHTLEALKIIESYLRDTEKDMTNFEASIITYKYGINYLTTLNDSDKNTVEYLIAKGILNFEQPSEFVNFYGALTNEIAIRLLYRVANKDARFDFSKVTLTDSQSYWKDKGYLEDSIEVSTVDEIPTALGTQEIEEEEESDKSLFEYLGFVPSIAYASTPTETIVERVFSENINYFYNGIAIKDIHKDITIEPTVVSSKYGKVTVNNVSQKGYTVRFSVKSKSYASAVAYLDKAITYHGSDKRKYVQGVTSVKRDGQTITLVPQSVLRETWTDIIIVKDKLLENKVTGTTATILSQAGYALVGGQVIVSDVLMEELIGGQVYYNIEIIAALLSNSTLQRLGASTYMFEVPVLDETTFNVYSTGSWPLGKAKVVTLNRKNIVNPAEKEPYTFINAADMGNYSNVIYRTFNFGNNEAKVTMIVHFRYGMFPNSIYTDPTSWFDSIKDMPMTIDDLNKFLYTRPDNENLRDWWDSNYGMSNALMNFIYGTKNIEYIKTGYLAPSITMAISEHTGNTEDLIQNFFDQYNFKITNYNGVSYDKYVGYTTYRFWDTYYKNEVIHSNPDIKWLASSTRKFSYPTGSAVKNGKGKTIGYNYGTEVFISSTGVVYFNPSYDNDFELKTSTKSIFMKTKLGATRYQAISVGTKVYDAVNKKYWIYCGTTEDGFIKLLPDFEDSNNPWFTGYPSYYMKDMTTILIGIGEDYDKSMVLYWETTNNKWTNIRNFVVNGITSIDRAIERKVDGFFSLLVGDPHVSKLDIYRNYFPNYTGYTVKTDTFADVYGASTSMTFLSEGSLYLKDGGLAKYSKGKLIKLTNDDLINSKTYKTTVTAIPYLYLPTGSYSVNYYDSTTGMFHLHHGYYSNAMSMVNPFSQTISRTVTDRILATELGVLTLEDIPLGSSISFGGYVWIRRDGYVETIIEDLNLARYVKSMYRNEASIVKELKKMFSGYAITTDRYVIDLNNYLSNHRIGSTVLEDGTATIYRKGNEYLVKSKGKDVKMTSPVSHLSIRVSLDESLQFVKEKSSDTRYRMLNYTNMAIMQDIPDLPFFNETLDYDTELSLIFNVDNSEYNTTISAELIGESFDKDYTKSQFVRFKFLVSYLIIILSVYICLISWASKVICENPPLRSIFDAFALRDSNGKHGLDLIKLLSFGIYSLDRDISYFKTIVISIGGLMFALITNRILL